MHSECTRAWSTLASLSLGVTFPEALLRNRQLPCTPQDALVDQLYQMGHRAVMFPKAGGFFQCRETLAAESMIAGRTLKVDL